MNTLLMYLWFTWPFLFPLSPTQSSYHYCAYDGYGEYGYGCCSTDVSHCNIPATAACGGYTHHLHVQVNLELSITPSPRIIYIPSLMYNHSANLNSDYT